MWQKTEETSGKPGVWDLPNRNIVWVKTSPGCADMILNEFRVVLSLNVLGRKTLGLKWFLVLVCSR